MRRTPIWVIPVGVIVLVGVVALVLAAVPSGMVAVSPHRPIDLNGRVRIDGSSPEPVNGRILMLGVEVRPLSQLQRLMVLRDRRVSVIPDPSPGQEAMERRRDREAIRSSKQIAAAVAFDMLGESSKLHGNGATVVAVDPAGPAAGQLMPGDRIVRVDGRVILTSVGLTSFVSSRPPGSLVKLGVRRDGLPYMFRLRTGAPPADDRIHRSRIGIEVYTAGLKIDLPHDVRISTSSVGGPSAGLAFALAVYDMRSPGDLVGGSAVAATGELALDGQVLPVGGIWQKAISAQEDGATLLLVPEKNAADARKALEGMACAISNSCLRVVGVGRVSEAVRVLRRSAAPDTAARVVS